MSGNPFFISADEIVAATLMLGNSLALVLIVEGESDEKLLSRHLDRSELGLVIAYGKANALQSASRLGCDNPPPGIRVLVDKDGDDASTYPPIVLTTEYWDLDAEVLGATRVLSQVALAFTGEYDLARLDALKAQIASTAAPMSALLAVAQRLRLGLGVAKLKLTRGQSDELLKDRVNAIVRQAASKKEHLVPLGIDSLVDEVYAVASAIQGDLRHHQGHFLHMAAANIFGKGVFPDRVQKFVWGALATDQLRRTSVGELLDNWARENGVDLWVDESVSAAA